MKQFKQHIQPDRHWRVQWSRIKLKWPFLVWLAAGIACAWLYYRNPHLNSASSFRGIVDAEAVALAAVETARIQKIHVSEGQQVRRGDLLVTMDNSLVAHSVSADLLDAIRIETAFGDTHQDVLQAVSQRLDAIAAIEADIAECNQEWEREAGQLRALEVEQKRRETLRASGVIDDMTRIELLPDIEALQKAVAIYPHRIAMYEKQLAEAQKYYQNMMEWLGGEEGRPVSEAIRRRLNEDQVHVLLTQARTEVQMINEAYKIRAPQNGTVSEIIGREGEVVAADIPILRLVGKSPDRIIGYVGEAQVAQVEIGQEVLVEGMHRTSAQKVHATVESVSAEVHISSLVLSGDGRQVPHRTQRAILRIRGAHPFVGGEAVFVSTPSPGIMGRLGRILHMVKRSPDMSTDKSS